MIETMKRIFSITELRGKILFTLGMLFVCRICAMIPIPGINAAAAVSLFQQSAGGGQNLFQLMDVFTGGAFAHMTIIALGVMPNISASIIMQLVSALVPSFQREIRENGELGRKKMNKYTRYLTLALALLQAAIYAGHALRMNESSPGVVLTQLINIRMFDLPILFYITTMFSMATGALILMWIGEQITQRGIGNGISLIITVGIVVSLPSTIGSIIQQLNLQSQEIGQLTFTSLVVLAVVFICIIFGTILVIQGQRKIPLQYARRVVGRHEVQGGNSYIPLKLNYAGVLPVIFASSMLMFPATIGQLMGYGSWLAKVAHYLTPGSWVYTIVYVLMILFFTYFWTATQFHPEQIASDMKKNGAFIPGVRQGKPTEDYLEHTMGRITFVGGIFLALVAILPMLVSRIIGVDTRISHFFGGTTILILVGVILDTTKQIESHLLMKRYDGFMKKGKAKGRLFSRG